jgi:hypothetical protein
MNIATTGLRFKAPLFAFGRPVNRVYPLCALQMPTIEGTRALQFCRLELRERPPMTCFVSAILSALLSLRGKAHFKAKKSDSAAVRHVWEVARDYRRGIANSEATADVKSGSWNHA